MTSTNHVHRFVVTLRWESSGLIVEQSEWRGNIVNVVTNEATHFRGIDGLSNAWQQITTHIPLTPDSAPEEI